MKKYLLACFWTIIRQQDGSALTGTTYGHSNISSLFSSEIFTNIVHDNLDPVLELSSKIQISMMGHNVQEVTISNKITFQKHD